MSDKYSLDQWEFVLPPKSARLWRETHPRLWLVLRFVVAVAIVAAVLWSVG